MNESEETLKVCRHCGAVVSQDAWGSWVDETDGDGCDSPTGTHDGI